MNETVIELVQFMERAYKDGWGYVWGAGGEVYTSDVAKRLYNTYGTVRYNSDYYLSKQMYRWGGKRVADCSGLIQAFRGVDDTANGLMQKCKQKGLLSQFDGSIGRLVFCVKHGAANHVGIVVAGGYVIHSTSSERRVIKERLSTSTRGWTHYGIPTWVDYRYETPTSTIKMGSDPEDIYWLQDALNRHIRAGLAVDGIYGAKTAKAVLVYRKSIEDWRPEYIGVEVPKRIIKALCKSV